MMDLLKYSLDNNTIGYNEEVFEALKELKQFNYEKIYNRRNYFETNNKSKKPYFQVLRDKFELIWAQSLNHLEEEDFEAPIFKDHIEYIDDSKYSTYYYPLKNQNKLTLIVRDYIAGMSDNYFAQINDLFKKSS